MATIWKGAVSFGLVNIPVRAEPATRETDSVRFRQLDKSNDAPIKMQRVNSVTGAEVPWGNVVKGYEYAKDEFIVMDQKALDALKVPTGRALDLIAFVDATEIDPRHYDTPYFLIPEATAERSYALLREAIRDSGVVGVGHVTMRQRTHVVTVRVLQNALVMDIIRPASALVSPDTLDLPGADAVRAPEKAMAEQLIAHLRAPFDTSTFKDEYQDAVRALVEAKLGGRKVSTRSEREPDGTPVIDLMARLKESLAHAGKPASRVARTAATKTAAAGTRKAPVRAKTAARKRRSA
jgi:DNA end-binding protein Ku